MKATDMHDVRQVVIPVRHSTSKPGSEPTKSFGHKDSILVGLGLILFLSFTWIYFVHRYDGTNRDRLGQTAVVIQHVFEPTVTTTTTQ